MTEIRILYNDLTSMLGTHPPLSIFFQSCIENMNNMIEILERTKSEAIKNIWSYEAKDYSLLLRNICFNLYKKHFFSNQNPESSYFDSLALIVSDAEESIKSTYEESLSGENVNESIRKSWEHYVSPEKTINNQIRNLIQHIEDINIATNYLEECEHYLHNERTKLQELLGDYIHDLEAITTNFDSFYKDQILRNDFLQGDSLKTALSQLKKILTNIQSLNIEKSKPEFTSESVKKKMIPANVVGGNIIEKEIDIKQEVRKWVDNNILSLLLDGDRLLEKYHEKVGSTMLNTNNRIELLVNEDSSEIQYTRSVIKDTWTKLNLELNKFSSSFYTIQKRLQERIENLRIEHIFSPGRLFLPAADEKEPDISIIVEDKWTDFLPVKKGHDMYNKFKNYLINNNIDQDGNLSAIIDFVKKKTLQEVDSMTMSLFLNKGYMGNSFVVKRDQLTNIISSDMENWRKGYRGSVLIIGKRLSGRSTLLEALPYNHPDMEVVLLSPTKEINFKSRKFQVNYNLEEALEFITKYAISDHVVVAIDDIELWRNSDHSLYENVVHLLEDLNKFSRRLFFIVSTNHLMHDQLDQQLSFSKNFTSVINCDEMSLNSIVKAIKIRHGASMRDSMLMDGNENEGTGVALNVHKMAKKVAKDSSYIIGAALKEWAHIHYADKEMETYEQVKTPGKLFDIIREKWTIFKHILKLKQTSEKEIMQMLGSSFLKEVSGDIQFLVSCKILLRDRNGVLSVNEFIVDEIESGLMNRQGKITI